MKNNNDVVILELDGIPRELRFGHKALKTYTAITGKGIDELGGNFSIDEIEKLIYCGLLSDARKRGETLKLEDMEDLLDTTTYEIILEKMTEALNASFGEAPNSKGIAAKK